MSFRRIQEGFLSQMVSVHNICEVDHFARFDVSIPSFLAGLGIMCRDYRYISKREKFKGINIKNMTSDHYGRDIN